LWGEVLGRLVGGKKDTFHVKYIFPENVAVYEVITRTSDGRPKKQLSVYIDLLLCAVISSDVFVLLRCLAVTDIFLRTIDMVHN
jgi:hypothetical protein